MSSGHGQHASCIGFARNRMVPSSLVRLVDWSASLAGSPAEDAERLAVMLLARPEEGPWRSSLNNDGSPLQVSVSLPGGAARPTVRLIADPAADAAADGRQRWRRVSGALSAVLASHAPDLKGLCRTVVERILPADPAALPGGSAWLAASLSGHGMALYATTKWGDQTERWMRTHRWLDEVLTDSSTAHDVLARLTSRSALVSVGVEGTARGNARVKLYWRLEGTAGLHDLGLPLFDSAAIAEFLFEVVEDRRIPRAGLVCSIGFRAGSGSISDVKLDICGHCVRRTPTEWMRVIERLVARHELARLPVACEALLESTELAFIGLGLDAQRTPRLNIYLKGAR